MLSKPLPLRAKVRQTTIELLQGDITKQDTDAIVNAANSALIPGGGVDGAINRAAGPDLAAAMAVLGGCRTGEAKITSGYNLPARHVIHAVGPVYQQDKVAAPQLLTSAYKRSLEIATQHGLRSIAFPAISTGVYGYPIDAAANIALNTIYAYVAQQEQINLVRVVLFTEDVLQEFLIVLETIVNQHDDLTYI